MLAFLRRADNNQWMVLDSAKFDPGAALPAADLFWVAEQIPGKIVAADMTATLTGQGFWPSYNIPFFKEIFDLSGCKLRCPERALHFCAFVI